MVAYLDQDLKFSFFNRAYAEWWEQPIKKLEGKTIQSALGLEDVPGVESLQRKALAGQEQDFETDLRHPSGDLKRLKVSYIPDRQASGEIRGLFIVLIDMTAQYRVARKARSLSQVTASLSRAVTREEVVQVLLDRAFDAFQARDGFLVECQPQGTLALLAAWGGAGSQVERLRALSLSKELPVMEEAISRGMPVFIESREELIRLHPEFAASGLGQGKASIAALPLMIQERVLGAVALVYGRTRIFPQETRHFMLTMATHFAEALERARLFDEQKKAREQLQHLTAQLVEANHRYNLAIEASQLGVWDWQVPAGKLIWSDQLERIFGLAPGSFEGTREAYESLIHPEDRERMNECIARAIETREPYVIEHRCIWPDGSVHWVRGSGQAYFDFNRELSRISGTSVLIDEQKAAETRTRALQEITAELARAATIEQIADVVVQKAVRTVEARCGILWLQSEFDPEVLECRGWHGYQEGQVSPFKRVAISANIPIAETVRTKKSVWLESVDEMALRFPAISGEGRAVGHQSWAVLPLVLDDQCYGGIGLSFATRRQFTDKDRTFLEAIASQCAQAMDRARHHDSTVRLATIALSSGDGIIGEDRNGIITSWNRSAERIFGYTGREILGKPIATLFPSELRAHEAELARSVLAGQRVEHFETFRLHKSGRVISVEVSASPMLDAQGNVIGISRIARDVTTSVRVRRNRKFLLEATSVLGSSLDYETTLEKVAKLVSPELADCCVIELLDNGQLRRAAALGGDALSSASEAAAASAQALRTGGSVLFPSPLPEGLARNGDIGVSSYISVLMKNRGQVLGVITFISRSPERIFDEIDLDLAEELGRRAGMAVDNALLYAEAWQAIGLRDQFISIASHELKTPLTAISLQMQMLERLVHQMREKDERARDEQDGARKFVQVERSFEVAHQQLRRLGSLVEDLLDVTRIEAGKLAFEFEEFDLMDLIGELTERLKTQLECAKMPLVLDFCGELSGKWDRGRLEQVFLNLLTNAMKYAPGSPLTIRAWSDPLGVHIDFEDRGPGIPRDKIPVIFDRFIRASESSRISGLGLGLFIVKEIVEGHGGRIGVKSSPEQGTVFSIVLPRDAETRNSLH